MVSVMPGKRKKADDLPRPPAKEMQVFRLMPDVVRNLKIAADRRGWSKTTYVQEAIRKMLKEDGLK
jgi:hypothetical protein